MRAIIIEDEEPARQLIKSFLSEFNQIELVGEYSDGFSGAVAINRDKPDLIFLDIQLPKLNGFELLELLEHNPQIIFTTAYDEHAVAAFERNATDYLLKPFSKERFAKAIDKALDINRNMVTPNKPSDNFSELTRDLPLNRIVVKDSKGINVIPINDIRYFEAQDDYVMIYTQKARFLKKQTLKNLEERLTSELFIRVHRSYIVNISEITKIEPYEKESYIALLKSGEKIKISASGYKTLREKLEF
jgi:two-component system LytT family response regulator